MSYLALAKRLSPAVGAAGEQQTLGAALLRSPRYGEAWIALAPRMVVELAAEACARNDAKPILLTEVVLLQGKSDAMKRALLTTLGAMPGSRVVQ